MGNVITRANQAYAAFLHSAEGTGFCGQVREAGGLRKGFALDSGWGLAPTGMIFLLSAGSAAWGLCGRHPGLRCAVPKPDRCWGQPEQQPPWQPGGCLFFKATDHLGSIWLLADSSCPPTEHRAHFP